MELSYPPPKMTRNNKELKTETTNAFAHQIDVIAWMKQIEEKVEQY